MRLGYRIYFIFLSCQNVSKHDTRGLLRSTTGECLIELSSQNQFLTYKVGYLYIVCKGAHGVEQWVEALNSVGVYVEDISKGK